MTAAAAELAAGRCRGPAQAFKHQTARWGLRGMPWGVRKASMDHRLRPCLACWAGQDSQAGGLRACCIGRGRASCQHTLVSSQPSNLAFKHAGQAQSMQVQAWNQMPSASTPFAGQPAQQDRQAQATTCRQAWLRAPVSACRPRSGSGPGSPTCEVHLAAALVLVGQARLLGGVSCWEGGSRGQVVRRLRQGGLGRLRVASTGACLAWKGG